MYTPLLTVNILNSEADRFSGQKGISHLKKVKEAMLANNLVALESLPGLNKLLQKHNAGTSAAGLTWGVRGPPTIMDMKALKAAFLKYSAEHIGKEWTLKETRQTLIDAVKASCQLKDIAFTTNMLPSDMTVRSYHSALKSDPDITLRKGKDKPAARKKHELSVRSMLSNAAGALAGQAIIGDDIPKKLQFKEEGVGEGALLSRSILAKAFNVSEPHVHFMSRGLLSNQDDMACYYSQEAGFQFEREPGLVLKDSVTNRSFSVHYDIDASASRKFNGRKIRFTFLLLADGSVGALWVQILGCTAREVPPTTCPEGIAIVEVEGLAPDVSITTGLS